jgi:hypothetical protein
MYEYRSTIKLCSSRTRTSSIADPPGEGSRVQMLKMTTRLIHIFVYLKNILQAKKTTGLMTSNDVVQRSVGLGREYLTNFRRRCLWLRTAFGPEAMLKYKLRSYFSLRTARAGMIHACPPNS